VITKVRYEMDSDSKNTEGLKEEHSGLELSGQGKRPISAKATRLPDALRRKKLYASDSQLVLPRNQEQLKGNVEKDRRVTEDSQDQRYYFLDALKAVRCGWVHVHGTLLRRLILWLYIRRMGI